MRVGHNPRRQFPAELLVRPVALGVVTHLPDLKGYHAERLEVVQTCLTTMRAGARMDHTFIVWDNGSGPELMDWLEGEFRPDILVKSGNVGKTAARTALFRMVHPRTILAYSDDDIYYYDNWLAPQMALLQHFPKVAAVTGYPVRTSFRWGTANTREWARKFAQLEEGRFLPREWENDFAVSVGREPEWHANYTKDDKDYRVTFRGVQAYATSHHCQFVAKAEVIDHLLQFDGWAMGDEKPFDEALDNVGLRLATTERLTRHIGNVLHDELRKELAIR